MASSGNFMTFNRVAYLNSYSATYSKLDTGNLQGYATAGGWGRPSNFTFDSGKWYVEFYIYVRSESGRGYVAVVDHYFPNIDAKYNDNRQRNPTVNDYTVQYIGGDVDGTSTTTGICNNQTGGSNPSQTFTNTRWVDGDIIGMALDLDSGTQTVQFYRNGSAVGTAETLNSSASGNWAFWSGSHNACWHTMNAGQDSSFAGRATAQGNADGNGFGDFYYTPPSGFLAPCSANLSVSDDIDPAQDTGPNTHFDVVTYTGNGSTQSITSLGFQPDWTLIKNRASGDWCNQNSSLGVGESQKWNDDGGVSSDTDAVTSFNSDGFSLGADSKVNTSSANYVAYCWKKSAEAGLDIVTYSGGGGSQAVSHSLGVTPDCIFIMLNTGTALDSIMYLNSASMGTSYGIFPTSANARQNTTYVSATTSSNFTVTGSADTSGRTYFAYVLKSIEGFSKFGEYLANANTDGPFTYLGFRPRLVIIKALESGQTWFFFDTARSTHNVIDLYLYGQRDLPESTAGTIDIDFLSNGFKIRSSGVDLNSSSGQAYAYLAWADVPFKYNNTF